MVFNLCAANELPEPPKKTTRILGIEKKIESDTVLSQEEHELYVAYYYNFAFFVKALEGYNKKCNAKLPVDKKNQFPEQTLVRNDSSECLDVASVNIILTNQWESDVLKLHQKLRFGKKNKEGCCSLL